MARPSEVIYYPSKRAYMTTIKGRRYRLCSADKDDRPAGPNYQAAFAQFQHLLASVDRPPSNCDLVRSCHERWIEHIKETTPKSLPTLLSATRPFVNVHGHLRAGQLEPLHLLGHLKSRPKWGRGMQYAVFNRVKQMFRWNHAAYCINDPFKNLSAPKSIGYSARGAEYLIDDELAQMLIAGCPPSHSDLLTVLHLTGARPGELMNAERMHYHPKDKCIIFRGNAKTGYLHKNARRKRSGDNDRVIYLDDAADEIAGRNAQRGRWLLPKADGTQIRRTSFSNCFLNIKRGTAVSEYLERHERGESTVIPYSFRHSRITAAIKNGVPIKTVADLFGTSIAMIEKHYSHATADKDAMRKAFLRCL